MLAAPTSSRTPAVLHLRPVLRLGCAFRHVAVTASTVASTTRAGRAELIVFVHFSLGVVVAPRHVASASASVLLAPGSNITELVRDTDPSLAAAAAPGTLQKYIVRVFRPSEPAVGTAFSLGV